MLDIHIVFAIETLQISLKSKKIENIDFDEKIS